MSETWTEENVATLRQLIADGASGGDAARELGLTRNQVIGKATRMGLRFGSVVPAVDLPEPASAKPADAAPAPVAKARPAKTTAAVIFSVSASSAAPRPAPPEVAAQRAEDYLSSPSRRHAFDPAHAPAGALFVSLVDLERGMCKWPLFEEGPRVFCGCTVTDLDSAGQPDIYCTHHRQMAGGTE